MKKLLLFTVLLTGLANTAFAKTVEYNLFINREPVTITGQTANKITVNGTIPGPTLRFEEGDEAVIHVTNRMQEETSVHWHGLLLPGEMDGVPGFNKFPGIMPGKTFTYRFEIRQSGTYWYHAHSAAQEQDGHYGSIVILPQDGEAARADKDYVVLISDFKDDESGNDIMSNLKKSADYYQYARRTIGDFFADASEQGFSAAWENAKMWGEMRMRPTDLADVSGYTFLTNGKAPEQNWTGLFQPGERVRLRFINASAMSFFDVRIPGLKMTVVSADGQNVEPVEVDEFRFGAAETYDVIVRPQENKAYTIAAESIDRTGFAVGTLAPREGMRGEIPAHRPRALLTMADMSMNHEGHDMSAMNESPAAEHSMHNMGDMSGMNHAAMGHQMPAGDSKKKDYETGTEDSGWADAGTPSGDRALKYKDLRYFGTQKDIRQPGREITVRLGGNMERFIWTINGKKFSDAGPIHLNYGERVRLNFINDTMMAHPMHLHGMFVQLENGQPAEKLPNKHTVVVAPGDTYSVLLTADEAGEWAFHCHLLYHMMAGMMNKVIVAKLDASQMPENHQMPMDHSNMNHEMKQPKPKAAAKPDDMKNMQQMDHSKMNHDMGMPEVKRQPEKPKSLPTPNQNHGEHNAH
ncbi:MAG TPA: copper oxidase [Rhodospirillaceae bacterium]|nr:copper oxidase [Rhodospirillaceae bacterium]